MDFFAPKWTTTTLLARATRVPRLLQLDAGLREDLLGGRKVLVQGTSASAFKGKPTGKPQAV